MHHRPSTANQTLAGENQAGDGPGLRQTAPLVRPCIYRPMIRKAAVFQNG